MHETNNVNFNSTTGLRIPTGQRQTSWLFTRMAANLNLGLLCPLIQLKAIRARLELSASEFQVQCSNHSAPTPCTHCLQFHIIDYSIHICLKVTKMGSIIGHRIDYNGLGALRDQHHIPSKS